MIRTILILISATSFVCAEPLNISVTATVDQNGVWDYTVRNDEPTGSDLYISTFAVTLGSPVLVYSGPSGWAPSTDYTTYVLWFNTDATLPYPHDIAPGESLSGFTVGGPSPFTPAMSAQAGSWNHALDELGPLSDPAKVQLASVPEPSSLAMAISGALGGFACWRRRRL